MILDKRVKSKGVREEEHDFITIANGFKSTRCFNNITDNYIMQLDRIKSNKI